MKKLLAFFLSCLLFATLLPSSYAAESPLIAPAPISENPSELPVLDIIGSLDGISKEDKIPVDFYYDSTALSFSSSGNIKLQGDFSLQFPKKNYNITLLKDDGKKNKVCLCDEWGKQSKYCLKANWSDPSQARNVVSGQIYNQIIHSRNIDDELASLPNGGVVDGFPIILKLNGEFLGLYTLNIPKDKWMFGMDDDGRQALLFGDNWSASTFFSREIENPDDVTESGWDLEYCSTEDDKTVGTGWVAESMNEFIRFSRKNKGKSFREKIDAYTNPDRLIDFFLFTHFTSANDNFAKNIMWASYDGVKWIPSVYDLDKTWGIDIMGQTANPAEDLPPFAFSPLFLRLLNHYYNEVASRYVELRSGPLSIANIEEQFSSFYDSIPEDVRSADLKRWPELLIDDAADCAYITEFAQRRATALDAFYGVEISDNLALRPSAVMLALGQSAEYTALTEGLEEGDRILWDVSGCKNYEISEDGLTCSVKAGKLGKIHVSVTVSGADGTVKEHSSASAQVKLFPFDCKICQKKVIFKALFKGVTFYLESIKNLLMA